jgi:hypothetical protein
VLKLTEKRKLTFWESGNIAAKNSGMEFQENCVIFQQYNMPNSSMKDLKWFENNIHAAVGLGSYKPQLIIDLLGASAGGIVPFQDTLRKYLEVVQ